MVLGTTADLPTADSWSSWDSAAPPKTTPAGHLGGSPTKRGRGPSFSWNERPLVLLTH